VIDLDGAANCRDLGGWAIPSGARMVRLGQVYRSTELNGLTDAGLDELGALGLRTVYDLRTSAERNAQPDRLPQGVRQVNLDVLADEPGNPAAGAAELPKLLADPAALEQLLAGSSLTDLFAGAYRGAVSLPSALASYRAMFAGLADAAQRPALFHCTTGKDRTGWGAAALLSFLGVSDRDVEADYLLTNSEILPLTQPMYDEFAAAGGDPDLLRPALGVEPAYLHAAFEEMDARFGSIEAYFTAGLGLGDDVLDALRDDLTAPAG